VSAIETKDRLLSLINGAENQAEMITVAKTVATVLQNTEGFWIELRYCYKASEIATRCQRELEHYSETCQHHKTLQMITKVRDRMRLIAERYYRLQQEQMMEGHNAIGLRYQSNAELAS